LFEKFTSKFENFVGKDIIGHSNFTLNYEMAAREQKRFHLSSSALQTVRKQSLN